MLLLLLLRGGEGLRRAVICADSLGSWALGVLVGAVARDGLMRAAEINIELPGASVGVGAHHGPILRPSELQALGEATMLPGGGEELCELLNGESTGVLEPTAQAECGRVACLAGPTGVTCLSGIGGRLRRVLARVCACSRPRSSSITCLSVSPVYFRARMRIRLWNSASA